MALTSRVYRIDGSEIVLVYELFAEGTRERLVEAAFHHALRNAPAAA